MIAQDPFGILAFLQWNHDWNNHYFNEDVLRKAVKQLGDINLSMVRMDILWADIHRGPGQYDFSKYDQLIALLKESNVGILGLLLYNKDYEYEGKEIWG